MKTIEELDQELCKYCRLTEYGCRDINTNQYNLCEGIACDEAYTNYIDEITDNEN